MPQIDVTILMPCLNEIRTLPACIAMATDAKKQLESLGLKAEILISDNGSTDGSVQLAQQLGCRVVHCSQRGYGNALINGCQQAFGKYIVMGDSDASYDFREGIAMVLKLQEGYDLCMGNRFAGEIKPGAMPFLNRHLGNPALSGLLNLFFSTGLRDAHSGLRAITKEAFHQLQLMSPGMEFASEMVVKASLKKLKTTELPITLHPDGRNRPPHLRPWQDGWRHLRFLLLLSPFWLFVLPSALLGLVSSLIFGILLTSDRNQVAMVGPFHFGDHWMVVAGALFNFSIMGFAFGLIAYKFSVQAGYRSSENSFAKLIDQVTFERGLVAGLALFCTGVAVLLFVVCSWYQSNFGDLARVREMVFGTTFMVTGLEIMFTSFVLALFHENSRPFRLSPVGASLNGKAALSSEDQIMETSHPITQHAVKV